MASKKMVAKIRFDDGSKLEEGRSIPYQAGEEYKGKDHVSLEKAGLICTEDDFEISQQKAQEAIKDRNELLLENEELRKELSALKNSKPSKGK